MAIHNNNISEELIEKEEERQMKKLKKLKNLTDEFLSIYNDIDKETKIFIDDEVIQGKKRAFKKSNALFKITKEINENPIVILGNGAGKTAKANINKGWLEFQKDLNIKRTFINHVENLYYYNEDKKYYIKTDATIIKEPVYKSYGFVLADSDLRQLLSRIPTRNRFYENIIVFNNILYDIETMQDLGIDNKNYERKDYLSDKLIGNSENELKEVELINYNEDLCLSDFIREKKLTEEMTFTEKVLRMILIPKNNPKDLRLFKDFLERFGSCIEGYNKQKTITIYRGDGDNGKSILKLTFRLIFNNKAYSIDANRLKDNFNAESFIGRLAILIDEINKNSFKECIDELKRMSSPESSKEQRAMYKSENIMVDKYAPMFLFINEHFDISLDQKAVFSRTDSLGLPNTFLRPKEYYEAIKKDPEANVYLIDNETEIKLKQDKAGLEWLITASLLCYKDMKEHKRSYLLKQSTEETIDIFVNANYISKFLTLYTKFDESLPKEDLITNKELVNAYDKYMKSIGKEYDSTNINKQMGMKIRAMYGENAKHKDSNTGKVFYRLILSSLEDLEKAHKNIYIINEYRTDKQAEILNYGDNNMVYREIQKGCNTINKLKAEIPHIDIIPIIKQLESYNLIIKTPDSSID